tara:strand:- start:493 stop:858 length:366 start_codon:yes stop_codon:yes gene_type:complete
MQASPYVYPGLLDAGKYKTITEKTIICERVVNTTCLFFNLKTEDVLGRRRFQRLILARCIIATILREKYSYTVKSIGVLLGNRDHSTIVNLSNRHSDFIFTNDEGYRQAYSQIKENLYRWE